MEFDDVKSTPAPTMESGGFETLPVSAARYDPPTINEIAKATVATALGYVPAVGPIVSALVGLLWPVGSGLSVWDQVRAEVEKMIDEKINEAVISLLRQELDGLGRYLQLYVGVVKSKPRDNNAIREHFIQANGLFVAAAPKFMNPNFEWTLAPLFAIFTHLHASILRDCVLHGRNWGWNSGVYNEYRELTRKTIEEYGKHFNKVKNNRIEKFKATQPTYPGAHNTDIYNHWYACNQQIIILLDDYQLLLEHLDPFTHPDQLSAPIPFKDVFSRAYGTADRWDDTTTWTGFRGVASRFTKPTAPFQRIDVELFNRGPREVKVTHASGTGPIVLEPNEPPDDSKRVDQYSMIADAMAGVEKQAFSFPPPGKDRLFNVQKARIREGSIPMTLHLIMDDGREFMLWDKDDLGGGVIQIVEVPGRMLTTLNMWTLSQFYNYNLGCIIFGFSYDHKHVPPGVSRLLYLTAIDEPKHELGYTTPPDATLKAERDAYWRHIESCMAETEV